MNDQVEFLELDPDGFDHVVVAGTRYRIPKGWENFRARMKRDFPGDGEALDRYFDLIAAITRELDALPEGQQVMLKLTLPSTADFYLDLVNHPRILRVVALSGGYSRAEADTLLRANHGVVASFSRALTEGLSAQQTEPEFDAMLDATIQSIYDASIT